MSNENKKTNSFITYEVSLYFEKDSELKIKNLIRQIAAVTQNFYRIEKEIPPHITLGMFKATETQKGNLKKVIKKLQDEFNNFEKEEKMLNMNKLDSFKNKILFLTFPQNQNANKESVLFYLNKLIHSELLKDLSPANNHLYLPQNFYPHCTVATGLSLKQINKIFDDEQKLEIPKQLVFNRIALAVHNPFEIIL
ncbi:MAG: hypothetical protein IJ937_04410 [Treponema sp.]|nr:hypothetical protein [Treponema sp.]